ncbi:hypothetical protein B566_EDAN003732 [Ephemera danica]|nr:hypothetical protein B566_EDAN003732 [Ephemera danica]
MRLVAEPSHHLRLTEVLVVFKCGANHVTTNLISEDQDYLLHEDFLHGGHRHSKALHPKLWTFDLKKKRRCSVTVSSSNRMLCCGHKPRLARAPRISRLMSQPPTTAVPPDGISRPREIPRH